MPVPAIRFTKIMTPDERSQSLNKMWDWCLSGETSESKAKVAVLQHIMEYAGEKLVVKSRFLFMPADQASEEDCQLCDTIFRHADLPELLFLQYVINQLSLIQSNPHPLKEKILPIVQQYKDTLTIPGAYEIRNIGFAAFSFSFIMRFQMGLLLSAMMILFSKQFENMRISRELARALVLKQTGGKTPPVEDGYDKAIGRLSDLSSKGYSSVYTLFSSVVAPAIQAIKKDTPKPSI